MVLKHYIDFLDGNGFIEVQPPMEWKNFSMNVSFEEGQERLSSDNFTWVGDNAELINEYVEGGGIFEGLPYQIRFTCDNTQYTLFDGCLNTASNENKYSCEEVEIGILERGKIDFVNETADSFRFEYLFAIRQTPAVPGQIDYSDFIDIWYVQGQYPQKFEILISSLTLFVTIKETVETIKRIADVIAEAFSVPSGGVTSALQLIYLAVYLGLIIVALIDLLQKLINLIFPFVYFHRGMYVRTLFEKGCEYLGLNFSSTIFDVGGIGRDEYVMPEKNVEGIKVGYNSLEVGYYEGTFGDLIRAYTEKFNADVKVIGNTLYFEREDFFSEQSTFIIPSVYQKPSNSFSYNASDVAANYVISYQYDSADLNNLSKRDGSQFTARIEPNTVVNRQNVLIKNLQERNIPFTLPYVKTTQSELETIMSNVFNGFANVINAVASVISPQSTPIPSIPPGGHINVLILDTHLTTAPKVGIYLGGGKTHPSSISNFLNAANLWGGFHAVRSAKGVPPFQPNQWKIYEGFEIPMCCEDFLAIKDNNYAKYQGNDAKILKMEWVPYDGVAKIDFMVRNTYAPDLKLTTIGWDGVTNVYT